VPNAELHIHPADVFGTVKVGWWGLFDHELYVEHGERRFGPYHPAGGPIPLHRYRRFKRTRGEERADRVEALAEQLGLPRAALEGEVPLCLVEPSRAPDLPTPVTAFWDPDPFQELTFPSAIAAKRAIADYLHTPLGKLAPEQLAFIDALLAETLNKKAVLDRIRHHFKR
jgi:hypothetical protein